MNIPSDAKLVWSRTAESNRWSKNYCRSYIELVLRNPESITPNPGRPDSFIYTGYGYGAVVTAKSGGAWFLIVNCFRDTAVA